MVATAWLRHLSNQWFGRPARNHVRKAATLRRRVRLCLEVLEDRLTPSAYTVTDASDNAGSANDVTLRYAINQAILNQDQNAVIDFSSSLTNTTIKLSLQDSNTSDGRTAFFISNANVTIDGSGAPGLVISGGNTLRPFTVASTASLTLENLTVEDGMAKGTGAAAEGGAIYSSGQQLTLTNVVVTKNTARGDISRATLDGASAYGGGLYVAGGTVTLNEDIFSDNNALGGKGLAAFKHIGGITKSQTGGNGGNGCGGGLYVADGTVTLTNDTLSSNQAIGGIGGLGGRQGVLQESHPSSFGTGGDGGNGCGGGLYVARGTVTLAEDSLNNNTVTGGRGGAFINIVGVSNLPIAGAGGAGGNALGGGVFDSSGTVTLSQDTLSSNNAIGGQGGMGSTESVGTVSVAPWFHDVYPTLLDYGLPHSSTGEWFVGWAGVGGNGSGGGLYVDLSRATLTLTNSTLEGNTVRGGIGGNNAGTYPYLGTGGDGSGGGLYVSEGTVTLTNDTLSGNTAQGALGGRNIRVFGSSAFSGLSRGGGLYSSPGPWNITYLTNTLIDGNRTSGLYGPRPDDGQDVFGNVRSSDHDLIGSANSGTLKNGINGDQVGSFRHAINPLLGPLANNGGPTETMALLPGSPAIDAGDSNAPGLPSTDQRGDARIVGNAVDIGAVEYQYDLAASGTATSSVVAGNTITYHITVTNMGPDTAGNGGGVVLTDVLPSGVNFISLQSPNGWTAQTPLVGYNGTVTVTTAALAPHKSAQFILVVRTSTSTPTSVANTVTIGPSTWDTNTSNNSIAFTTAVQYKPIIRLWDASGTYNGQPFSVTATALELDRTTPVSGSFIYTYYAGSRASGTPLSGPPTSAGTYTVVAKFTSSDPAYTNGSAKTTFTIRTASTTTTASNVTVAFSTSAQEVTLSASVGSSTAAVNEGTVTFTILQGSTVIGTATTSASVQNGQASVSYVLPAGFAAGSYTIEAVYNPGPDFRGSSDIKHTLEISSAS